MSKISLNFESLEAEVKVLRVNAENFTDILTPITNIVPTAQKMINSVIDHLTLDRNIAIRLNEAARTIPDLTRALGAYRIVDYDRTLAVTPSGFKGRFDEYLLWLSQSIPVVAKAVQDDLETTNMYMAVWLTDRETKRTSIDMTGEIGKERKKIDAIRDTLSTTWFSSRNADSNRQPITTVLGRFGDIDDLVRNARKLDGVASGVSLTGIDKNIRKLTERLRIAEDQLGKMEADKLSGESVNNLATSLLVLAKEVEFLATLIYHAETAIGCTLQLIEQIDRLTKK